MGGVAEDDGGGLVVVGAALDADEGQVRVRVEGVDQVLGRDEVSHAGEVLVEEGRDAGGVAFELGRLGAGEEEGGGEGAVLLLVSRLSSLFLRSCGSAAAKLDLHHWEWR